VPQNKSVVLCASGVVVLAALAHLARPSCPNRIVETTDRDITDPQWGILENLNTTPSGAGELFTATEDSVRHRLIRSADLSTSGTYRVAVETRYAGSSHMAIEVGGPGQPYAIVNVDLKNGTVTSEKGALANGVEQLAEPGSYRWWIDLDLKEGRIYYNFALLSWAGANQFPGSGVCEVVLEAPSITVRSDKTRG
jgi:hypothetical protein